MADALNNKAMTTHAEAMLLGNFVTQLSELIGLKFRQLAALDTIKVIVLWIAVVGLVDASPIQLKSPQ